MPSFARFFPLFKISHAISTSHQQQQPSSTSSSGSGEEAIANTGGDGEEPSNKYDRKKPTEKYHYITKAEFFEPIQNEYLRQISELSPEELYDNYNPGPTKPDGSVNFECHCVSHMVASPCGYAFRKAMTCQKAASDAQLEKGACSEEFMEFIECVMKTNCFRRNDEEPGAGGPSAPESREEE